MNDAAWMRAEEDRVAKVDDDIADFMGRSGFCATPGCFGAGRPALIELEEDRVTVCELVRACRCGGANDSLTLDDDGDAVRTALIYGGDVDSSKIAHLLPGLGHV